MNTPEKVDGHALRISVRIQAALTIIPRLAGPRHAWVSWMRDNVERELQSIKPPSVDSRHPTLLGSLRALFSRYYSNRLNEDILRFEDLRAEDPAILAPEYVGLPLPLPELEEPDRWWENLPPSISFKEPSPPLQPPCASDTSIPNAPDPTRLKVKLKVPPLNPLKKSSGPKCRKNDHPSQAGQEEVVLTGKKRPAEEDHPPRRDKRIKRASRKTIVSDDDDDEPRPGPSKRGGLKGKARAVTPDPAVASEEPEGPQQACDACKSRGSECVWPTVKQSASVSQNEKRACTTCVSQKTRCYIEGVFSIRRPRGKAATSQHNSLQDTVAKQQQEILEVKEQLKKFVMKLVVQEQEKAQLLSSVGTLEATVAQLSLQLSSRP